MDKSYNKVTFTMPMVAAIQPPLPDDPRFKAWLERCRNRVCLDVEMQLYDPLFRDFCKRMGEISGRSHLDVAEAGYGMSDDVIRWKPTPQSP